MLDVIECFPLGRIVVFFYCRLLVMNCKRMCRARAGKPKEGCPSLC